MTADGRPSPVHFFDQDMPCAHVLRTGQGTAAILSRRCPGKETANEDAAAVLFPHALGTVLLVADGLGGMAAGERASRIAVESVSDALAEVPEGEALLRTAILNGIEGANQRIQSLGSGAGTTLAIVEIVGREMRPYHVGDSMIMVIGGRGKRKWQTISHSPVGYGVEAGLLDASEAMHHEDRHIISNFVGSPEMRIEIGPVLALAKRDTVLIASDGLFDNLLIDEIVEIVRRGPLEKAALRLADAARERMQTSADGQPSKPDDLTLALFRPC